MIGETRNCPEPETTPETPPEAVPDVDLPVEIGGRDGPEPTRFGDWEKNGRCIDF
ncbi:MAG: DUF1674 domain-containing protein [Pseudoxanthomonas suwonensis]|nr:DUF1674 domain-containing protein [Pseudoxanthomonas suwonensis]